MSDSPIATGRVAEEPERFTLRGKGEIVHVLGELAKETGIITAYGPGDDDYLLTRVIAVLAERNTVVFAQGTDEVHIRRLLEAECMNCVATHNQITIRFSVKEIQQGRYQNHAVFTAPIPDSLVRLQRRDFFRVATPLIEPVVCRITQRDSSFIELPLADISGGGLCLLDPHQQFNGVLGERLKQCVLLIPGHGPLQLSLEVRTLVRQSQCPDSPLLRIGCRYGELSGEKGAVIQRFILKLQVERTLATRAL